MGTRSLTVFVDHEWSKDPAGDELVVMYRQFDGYPEGHGKELAEFLDGFTVVNGIGLEQGKIANGAGCLAAQVVAHFKEGVGGFYLHRAGTRDAGEEFIYTVHSSTRGGITITVKDTYGDGDADGALFDGTPAEFLAWLPVSVADGEGGA